MEPHIEQSESGQELREMVIPFGASFQWLEEYLRGGQAEVRGKERSRCLIRGSLLTVPVEGGAGVLKKHGSDPILSEHGKWRKEHLGAWQAAYGRTPYYEHLMPEIAAVYEDSEGLRLNEFNRRLLEVAMRWIALSPCDNQADAELLTWGNKDIIRAVSKEISSRIDPKLSIFDAIFRLGKETGILFSDY